MGKQDANPVDVFLGSLQRQGAAIDPAVLHAWKRGITTRADVRRSVYLSEPHAWYACLVLYAALVALAVLR